MFAHNYCQARASRKGRMLKVTREVAAWIRTRDAHSNWLARVSTGPGAESATASARHGLDVGTGHKVCRTMRLIDGEWPNAWCPWPLRVHNPNGIWIGSAVFARLTFVSNRQIDNQTHTDHAASVARGCTFALRERERFLFTKANIQYQYHKTITSGRLPEEITHQAGCL